VRLVTPEEAERRIKGLESGIKVLFWVVILLMGGVIALIATAFFP